MATATLQNKTHPDSVVTARLLAMPHNEEIFPCNYAPGRPDSLSSCWL